MNTDIKLIEGSITDQLLKFYPSGLVLGDSKAIVGKFGLTINWFNGDGTKGEKRYNENERLPITEVKGETLILSEPFSGTKLNVNHFKGFEKDNQ